MQFFSLGKSLQSTTFRFGRATLLTSPLQTEGIESLFRASKIKQRCGRVVAERSGMYLNSYTRRNLRSARTMPAAYQHARALMTFLAGDTVIVRLYTLRLTVCQAV
ncbi:MAG: hypothetical protein ACREKF_11080 [Candidatus Methylomirabilales bacterium]